MIRSGISLLVVLYFLIFVIDLQAQISEGGIPPSFQTNLKSWQEVPLINLPEVDEERLQQEDYARDPSGQCEYRIATGFLVDLDPGNSGLWEEINGDDKLWRLRILSKGAQAIHVFFDKYVLPEDARLFIYNREKTEILGAFTFRNNKSSGQLAIAPVRGEEITIEYFEPAEVLFSGQLHISTIGHNYRGNSLSGTTGFGDSEPCNKDINCTEGKDWQKEKRSVCMILFQNFSGDYFICSGALINTANNDGKPYLLTANHCLPTAIEAGSAVFYFNYESPACLPRTDGDMTQTVSGSTIRGTYNRLDFCLVELSTSPLPDHKPYYSGWDITTNPPQSCTTIHHPLGDVKKISFYNKSPVTGNFIYRFDFDDNTHWYIDNWSKGITQGGSSGSPLYNQDHRIVGDLTGGTAEGQNCTSADAYYAKFSDSWANYSDSMYQLKYWLDPDNSGVTFVDGYDPFVTGLNNHAGKKHYISIDPNPSEGLIMIDFNIDEPVKMIRLFDLSGRLMKSWSKQEFIKSRQLDLSSFPSGIYMIEIQTSTTVVTQKLILK